MELPTFFTTPTGIAVIAAGASFVAGLSGAVISSWTIRRTHKERLQGDGRLAERRFQFDKELAEKRFALDSAFADRKRRQELAEEVLSGFYQVRDIMQVVRSPMSFCYEAEGRAKPENEPADVAHQRNTYYPILARLEARREPIASLIARRYRMAAWFGPAAEVPFQILHDAISEVQISATLLVDWSGDEIDREHWSKMKSDIWRGREKPDKIDMKINDAIEKIELVCRSTLEGKII